MNARFHIHFTHGKDCTGTRLNVCRVGSPYLCIHHVLALGKVSRAPERKILPEAGECVTLDMSQTGGSHLSCLEDAGRSVSALSIFRLHDFLTSGSLDMRFLFEIWKQVLFFGRKIFQCILDLTTDILISGHLSGGGR